MTELTKITIVGSRRRATLVVPSDEPLGVLLPELAGLLGEADLGTLIMTRLGVPLFLEKSLDQNNLSDGAVLQLVAEEHLPPPPEVTDVIDRVAELRDSARGIWNPQHRLVIACLALGVVSAALNWIALQRNAGWSGLLSALVLALCSGVCGRFRWRQSWALLLGGALGAVLPAAWWVSQKPPPQLPHGWVSENPVAVFVLSLYLIGWLVFALSLTVSGKGAGAAVGVGAVIVLVAVTIALSRLSISLADTAGIVAAIALLGVGVLPALAINMSGLGTLDDRRVAGVRLLPPQIDHGLRAAHHLFLWSGLALASVLLPATVILISAGTFWPELTGAAVVVVAVLRTRVIPLAATVWALWIAGVGGSIIGVVLCPCSLWVQAVALGGIGLCALVAATASPAPHQRVRLRRLGDLLEAVAAIAIVPLIVGGFGLYATMLGVAG